MRTTVMVTLAVVIVVVGFVLLTADVSNVFGRLFELDN
jgi:hypothetical protein